MSVCVDRANRRCINLIAGGTIENHVLEVIRAKTEVFRRVIDGDFSDPANESNFWEVLAREFKVA